MIVGMLKSVLPIFLGICAFAQTDYSTRRERVQKALPDGVVVLFALGVGFEPQDRSGFFQEPNFYYLSGWNEPNAAMVLCGACPEGEREVLFLPKRNARKEIFEGPMVAGGDPDAKAKTGFAAVMRYERLEAQIARSLEYATDLYTVFDGHEAQLGKIAPLRSVKDARLTVTQLRLKKSAGELGLLQKAIDASVAAHLASWRQAKPGLYEYEVAADMQQTYFALGCQRNAYPPIVGSGPNSVILHYNTNRRRMDSGEVLLLDVAGECSMYSADITRTIPVDGKWSARQREVYELVLGAQNAAIAAAKPGVMRSELTNVARAYFNKNGKGPEDKPWGDYLLHNISHHIGLDVHDPFDPELPLEEGNVITIEPGLYIASEKLGVRIEDMILITKDGSKLLTGALPREAGEIERRMKH